MAKYLKISGSAAAGVLVFLLVVPFLIPKSLYLDRAVAWTEGRFPVKLQIGDAHLSFLPRVAIGFDRIQLTMKGDRDPLFSCGTLKASVDWTDLLMRNAAFGFSAADVEAHIVEISPDHYNYDPLLAGLELRDDDGVPFVTEARADTGGSAVSVRRLDLKKAKIVSKPYGEAPQTYEFSKLSVDNIHNSPSLKSMDVSMDGRLDEMQIAGDAALKAELQDPKGERGKLTVRSHNVTAAIPGKLALEKENVSLESAYTKSDAKTELQNGVLKIGPQTFSVGGTRTKKGAMDLALASDKLDLDYLKKILPGLKSLPPVENVGLKARYVTDGAPRSKPTISGNLKAAKVSLPDQELKNLSTNFVYRDPSLKVDGLSAETLDGTMSGGAALSMAPQDQSYNFDVAVKNAAMDKISSVGKLVQGRGDLSLKGNGQGFDADKFAKTLKGDGNITIRQIRIPALAMFQAIADSPAWDLLKKVPGAVDDSALQALKGLDSKVNDLASAFQIVNGVVQIPRVNLQFPQAAAVLNGGIGLDKSLNFSGTVALQRALVATFIKNPQILDALAKPGPLEIPIKIGGAVTHPTVAPDVDAIRSKLQAAVTQGIQQNVQQTVQNAIQKGELPKKEDLPTKDQVKDFLKKF